MASLSVTRGATAGRQAFIFQNKGSSFPVKLPSRHHRFNSDQRPQPRIKFYSSPSSGNVGRNLNRCVSSSAFRDESSVLTELPCLPFTPEEIFLPGAIKTLHLYEARYLALLDEAMQKTNGLFAHVIVQPMDGPGSYSISHASLVEIDDIKEESVGAYVTIRGISRLKLVQITQVETFIKGIAVPVVDEKYDNEVQIRSDVGELRAILSDVQSLQIRLRTPSTEKLQTPLEDALQWATKASQERKWNTTAPTAEELVSFAALQPVAGASNAELHRLLQTKVRAMELTDTVERVSLVIDYAKQSRASLAAKLALQSLG